VGIRITNDAVEVLRRSLEMGGLSPATAGIRLRAGRGLGGGLDVQVELAEGPLTGEEVVEARGLTLFVDPEVQRAMPEAVVAVEPQHDLVVVRREEPT
jgi:hypothetical protein